jgi:hypothetical protein
MIQYARDEVARVERFVLALVEEAGPSPYLHWGTLPYGRQAPFPGGTVLSYFAQLPSCLIGLEACGGAHYWARELGKLGHDVRFSWPPPVWGISLIQKDTGPKGLVAQPLGASPPRQRQNVPTSAAKFVICDHTIEETFRDCKGRRWGLGLQEARSRDPQRWAILLLIGTLATVIHWLVGLAASAHNYARHFQANTLKKRAVLSVCFLGQQVLHSRRFPITRSALLAAAQRIPALCAEQTQWA